MADFNNWRVVNQTELTPIVDAIAAMTGFGEVKSWFLSAVPKLSQYFVVPESRMMHVRFKVAAQNSSFNHITGRPEEQAYLGVDPDRPPKPIQMSLERLAPETEIHEHVRGAWFWKTVDLTFTTRQVDVHRTDAMFFPYSVQAPVLMFPGGKEVGTTQDPKLMQTVWRLEVAQGYSVRLSLSLNPLRKINSVPARTKLPSVRQILRPRAVLVQVRPATGRAGPHRLP